ncbi:MAG: SLC13 family permease [Candidatus Nanopelagicales bacterium]
MSWQAWVTLGVLVAVLALLIRSRTSPAVVVFGGTILLLAFGVITTEEALSGFANPAPITVAALYVVARSVEQTGALTPLMHRFIGKKGYVRRPLARVMLPSAGASAFLNNTPIMAMLIPQISDWADRRRVSVSRLLMPLSFATILGGTITVIGTSTNLVVNGKMIDSGLTPIGFFEIGKLGLPLALIGVGLVVLLAPRVLPARRSVRAEMEETVRRFTVEMTVVPNGAVDGKTVEEANLRDLQGVFLTSVDRGDTVIAPVRPDTVLRGGNRLRFAGQAGKVLDLHERRGLQSAELEHVVALDDPRVRYFEVVVGSRSPLVGSTLRDVGFRSEYQAAVVAIHRDGHLLDAKLGSVQIRVGDTLIVVSDPDFRDRWQDRADFLLIAEIDGNPPKPTSRAWIPIALLAAIVILAATGLVPILIGSLFGAVAVVALGILTAPEARRAVDLEVIVVIASAFGLAAAMQTSGLALTVANGLVHTFDVWGERGVLLGVVVATIVLTEMVTNNAAALLMLPIGLTVAAQTALDPRGVAIAIAVAASASFLTPIGYQTNTMVYGPGGYRFGDYARLGFPLTIVAIAVIVSLTPVLWP